MRRLLKRRAVVLTLTFAVAVGGGSGNRLAVAYVSWWYRVAASSTSWFPGVSSCC